MQTPFERKPETGRQKPDWAAQNEKHRSVFGNYAPTELRSSPRAEAPASNPNSAQSPMLAARHTAGLQTAIDSAIARAFLHQFLARAFEDPARENWRWLTDAESHSAFQSAVRVLTNTPINLETSARVLAARLQPGCFEPFQVAYVTAFGHAARGDCPLNEIEYGDLKADPLFQPHRLADLAAFYHAFGLELADGAAERPDHIGMELEFMSVMAAKEAYALEQQVDDEDLFLCRDAQRKFLREHLGRWAPAFARRLAGAAADDALAALAQFLRDFIAAECARFGIKPGSEDLLLRPVDEAAETLCGSCGLQNLPPGAMASGGAT